MLGEYHGQEKGEINFGNSTGNKINYILNFVFNFIFKSPRRQEFTNFMYGFHDCQIMSGTQKLSQNNTPEPFNRILKAIFDP